MNITLAKFPKSEFDIEKWLAKWYNAGLKDYLFAQRNKPEIQGMLFFEDAMVSHEKQDLAILFHPEKQLDRPDADIIWVFVPVAEEQINPA